MSIYLPWPLRSMREGAQGGAHSTLYSNGPQWPNKDGANFLS